MQIMFIRKILYKRYKKLLSEVKKEKDLLKKKNKMVRAVKFGDKYNIDVENKC